jgi:hypothetical protein
MTTLREAAKQALELLQSAHVATALVWPRHDCVEALKAALEQPEPDIYSLPTNKKEPRPGLVNLEEFPGFIYQSPNGWHIGDMQVVKWLLNNREADYWAQFKEKS